MEEPEKIKILKTISNLNFKNEKSFISKKKIFFFISSSFIILWFLLKIFVIKVKKAPPKVSVFLPIHNKGKYLKRTIENLQSQTLKDIEIVAVNDGSTDNSLDVLKELAKNDSRIKIIDYYPNRGALYSRAMGVVNCAGEYILNLDADDKLNGNDTLEFLYKRAKNSNLDIILYSRIILYSNGENQTAIRCRTFDKIIYQPELYKVTFNDYNQLRDYLIWNKLIKKEVYLKAYKFLEKRIFGEKWTHYDDNIWSVLVHKFANSMECINKTLYVHILNPTSLTNQFGSYNELKSNIDRYEMFEQIYTSKEEKKYLINEFFNLLFLLDDIGSFKFIINENDYIRNWVIKKCNEFINEYPNEFYIIRKTKHFLKKLINDKIIIFKKDYNNLDNDLTYNAMLDFIKNFTNKSIIHANILSHKRVKEMQQYIYKNDIIVGLNYEFNEENWIYFEEKIIYEFTNNTCLLFHSNSQNVINKNINNRFFKNRINLRIFVNNEITFNYLNNNLNNKIYLIPNVAIYYENNYKDLKITKEDKVYILIDNEEDKENNNFKGISKFISNYFSKVFDKNIKSIKYFDKLKLFKSIRKYKLIITDNWFGMITSIITGTSCIILQKGNEILKSEYNKWFKNLDYIEFIQNFTELEQKIRLIKNKATPNIYQKREYNNYFEAIKKYFE